MEEQRLTGEQTWLKGVSDSSSKLKGSTSDEEKDTESSPDSPSKDKSQSFLCMILDI